MTQLRITKEQIKSCHIGPDSPLPQLLGSGDLHSIEPNDEIPLEIRRNLQTGKAPPILPYAVQDDYDRTYSDQDFDVAILENNHIRATFLLGFGGRLYSLFHKDSQRELLHIPPAFQLGNLAIRNAWFCGGVEWNCGIIGHSPQTCAPIHAARLESETGEPILRVYELERIRNVVYQIDFCLPTSSQFLFVTVTIRNPNDHCVPMYWWSNIAVMEAHETRVLVPAKSSYSFGYTGSLSQVPVPFFNALDITYPSHGKRACDYFFDISTGSRKWIAAVHSDGHGLVQTSTALLKGRKLFLWGRGKGGNNWQKFLSPNGNPYLEIQAGLATTQLEYVEMPPNTNWTWTEAYGPINAPDAHDPRWEVAIASVESSLTDAMPAETVEELNSKVSKLSDKAPVEILFSGSDWAHVNESAFGAIDDSAGTPFSQSKLSEAESAWMKLLNTGSMSDDDASFGAFMTDERWRPYLESASDACSAYHLGILNWLAGSRDEAVACWKRSLKLKETAWAHRNLGLHELVYGDPMQGLTHYRKAFELKRDCLQLVREYMTKLVEQSKYSESLDLFDELSLVLRQDGRIRFIQARAALAVGKVDIVKRFFDSSCLVPDLREGEESLDALWTAYASLVGESKDVPNDIDFRMFVLES